MKTVKSSISKELVEKKSKFICDIFYVENTKQAEEEIENVRKKYHDAKHHCFAYRVLEENKITERASDDGEPSGTAGMPMLNLLSKSDLVNIVVVVTRYFGGILLGTGGLLRAYTESLSQAIQKAELVGLEPSEKIKIPITYQNISYLQYYCQKNGIFILKINFEDEPYAIIELPSYEKEKILHEIIKKQFPIEKIEILAKGYIQTNR